MLDTNKIIKLECVEKTHEEEFLRNVTHIKATFDFTQIIELTAQNKIIKNLSNSNIKSLIQNVRSLSLIESKIQSINKNIFNLMPNLNKIDFSRNEINKIENDSFLFTSFESNILELFLTENKLTEIRYGQFNGLSKLETLFLDKNQIEEIESHSFENLLQLKHLRLHSNKIKLIENEMLSGEIHLEILYLHQNNIEKINTIPFNTLRSLKKLYMSSNKITQIKFGNFIHLQLLDELKLDKNEIGSFKANTFVGLEKLAYLDLSSNKIKQLVNEAFNGLTNTIRLDLHLNDIEQIEMNALSDLTSLEYLNLDSNQIITLKNVKFNLRLVTLTLQFNMISSLKEIASTSLKYLFLAKNLIQVISDDEISLLPNLEHLDLSENRLIKIEANSFAKLTKLKHLNLSFNKLDLNNCSYFKSQVVLDTLDLSFNEIKYLDSNLTFQGLISLIYLNISNNRLKSIDSFIFEYLNSLNELNLNSNNLKLMNFLNLNNLETLKLSFNQIEWVNFSSLINLKSLDLDFNRIVSIEIDFNPKLIWLNLNSNPIETISTKTLKTLQISNTNITSLYLSETLNKLDLSYLNVSIIENTQSLNIFEWINLAHTNTNISFDRFLSNSTIYVDISFNYFEWNDFKMFNVLGIKLDTLKLRQTNLQQMEQIDLSKLVNLKQLDLSFNNLTYLNSNSFEFNGNLEYLDLSWNKLYEFSVILPKLRYLNVENNQINVTNEYLFDYFYIDTLKMGNNRLEKYPLFDTTQINNINAESFQNIYLNQNQLTQLLPFTFIFGKLKLANFDTNKISFIETDAFLNCRSLEYLSLANNRLTNISENNFHFLFSLIHLNLSSNEIDFIENNSFRNLNKLESLDLNYNCLVLIEDDLFFGLTNLDYLYLLTRQNELNLTSQSLRHLPNISTIVLNESLIEKNKCLFMNEMDRDVRRNVSNKFIFYKSINLITNDFLFEENLKNKCALIFHLFQFKIHFNLKTDHDNDLFFDACEKELIERENSFVNNKRKCFSNVEFDELKEESDVHSLLILNDFANVFYLLCLLLVFLTIVILSIAFFYIFKYELFSDQNREALKNEKRIFKEIENKIERNRKNMAKIISSYSKLNELFQKNEIEFERLEYERDEFISSNKTLSTNEEDKAKKDLVLVDLENE